MADHHVTRADVDEHVVDAFLDEPPSRRRQRGRGATLHRLLTYLLAHGVTRPTVVVVDDSPLAQLETRYQHYLRAERRAERGLAATTVQTYVGVLRQFVSEHGGGPRRRSPRSARVMSRRSCGGMRGQRVRGGPS